MDSLVKTCESASNAGVDTSIPVLGSEMFGWMSMPSLLQAFTVMDSKSYSEFLGVVKTQQQIVGRWVSLQCAVNRRDSSSQNSVSDKSSTSGLSGVARTGGRSAKLDGIKRAASWRKKAIPDGFCYTRMFKAGVAEAQATRLGAWPTVASLLQTSASAFKTLDELESFRVVGDKSVVHVEDNGGNGSSLLRSFSVVAQGLKTSEGTLGSALRSSELAFLGVGLRITARTAVGGSLGGLWPVCSDRPVGDKVIFLAGSNEKNSGPGWREPLVERFTHSGVVVASPRSVDLKHMDFQLSERAAWERKAMAEADVVLMHLKGGSASSVSMAELGLLVASGKLIVSCDELFGKRESVVDLCGAYGVPCFKSLDDAVAEVDNLLLSGVGGTSTGCVELELGKALDAVSALVAGASDDQPFKGYSVAVQVMGELVGFRTGLANERERMACEGFLRRCPEYVSQCPSLASVSLFTRSESALKALMFGAGTKVIFCRFADGRGSGRGEVGSLLDHLFGGYKKVPFLGGYAYVTGDRNVEWFGPERMEMVKRLNSLGDVTVRYLGRITEFFFS